MNHPINVYRPRRRRHRAARRSQLSLQLQLSLDAQVAVAPPGARRVEPLEPPAKQVAHRLGRRVPPRGGHGSASSGGGLQGGARRAEEARRHVAGGEEIQRAERRVVGVPVDALDLRLIVQIRSLL